MNTVFQKYAAALLPFVVLIVGASQTIINHPLDWVANLTFGLLVLGAIATYIVKLIPDAAWQGRTKTGIAILTTIIAAVLPFIVPGGFSPSASIPILIIAVLNALATELGVQIRIDAPMTDGPAHLATAAYALHPSSGNYPNVSYSAPLSSNYSVPVASAAAAAVPPVGNVAPPTL